MALASQALVDATHEVDIDKNLFPAGVVEQIYLQLKTVATVRKAWEAEDRFTYQVQSPSEALSTRLEKQGVVLTAENMRFVFRRVTTRVTLETVFTFGTTGKGSTERDLVPEVGESFGLSSHLVKCGAVGDVLPSAGFIGSLKFPYSSERYDLVYELLFAGSFALCNPNKPHLPPLEVFIAPTLKELEHITGVAIVRSKAAIEKEDKEELAISMAPLNLTSAFDEAGQGAAAAPSTDGSASARCVLVPMRAWRLHACCARAAAEEGRRRGALVCGQRRALRRAWRMLMRAHSWGALSTWLAGRTAADPSVVSCFPQCIGQGQVVSAVASRLREAGANAQSVDDVGVAAGGVAAAWDALATRREAWVASRRMDRQLGWGYAARMRAARRRK